MWFPEWLVLVRVLYVHKGPVVTHFVFFCRPVYLLAFHDATTSGFCALGAHAAAPGSPPACTMKHPRRYDLFQPSVCLVKSRNSAYELKLHT